MPHAVTPSIVVRSRTRKANAPVIGMQISIE